MNNNYLIHHGVKGMKWGVRRAQRFASLEKAHNAKVATSKTGIGKRYHINRAEINAFKKDRRNASMQTKGLMKKASIWVGNEREANMSKHLSNRSQRNVDTRKLKVTKHLSGVNAYNFNEKAKSHARIANSKDLISWVGNNFAHSYARPMKSISGRETTNGKEFVISYFTAGLGNIALDAIDYGKRHTSA